MTELRAWLRTLRLAVLSDDPAWPTVETHDLRDMILETSPEGLAGCFAAVRDADFRHTNTIISVPTLVIGGADDRVTLAIHSRDIAEQIAGANLVILPGVHMLNVERPDEFLNLVVQALGETQT